MYCPLLMTIVTFPQQPSPHGKREEESGWVPPYRTFSNLLSRQEY